MQNLRYCGPLTSPQAGARWAVAPTLLRKIYLLVGNTKFGPEIPRVADFKSKIEIFSNYNLVYRKKC